MTQEQLRMQMLAGIITEGQYKTKLEENTNPVTFNDLYNFAKKIKGFKGERDGFQIPYKYGSMSIDKISDNESDVTWWSGGDPQDTDTYNNSKILDMLNNL